MHEVKDKNGNSAKEKVLYDPQIQITRFHEEHSHLSISIVSIDQRTATHRFEQSAYAETTESSPRRPSKFIQQQRAAQGHRGTLRPMEWDPSIKPRWGVL